MRTRSITGLWALLLATLVACTGGSGAGMPSPAEPGDEAAEGRVHAAMATITAGDMAREIGVLAHDSMRGRDTPSPELEAAAEYLANRFRSMGLEPAGENGTYIHRFEWEVTRLIDEATVVRAEGVEGSDLEYGVDFFMVPGQQATTAEAAYIGVAGEVSASTDHKGKIVFMDHPVATLDQSWQRTTMAGLQPAMLSGAAGIVFILDPEFPAGMVSQLARATAGQQAPVPVAVVTSAGAERLVQRAGGDLGSLRSAGEVRSIGDTPIAISWERSAQTHTPPNVVAMLPGSDSVLRETYVVLTAHFDHVGVGAPDESGDSIYNGADDDASGTAAVVEMAEAFASLPVAPARSVIFLAVSAEEKGLLGSMAYAADPPMIEIDQIVANVNMDMISRNAPDTVIAIGQEYSTLQAHLDEITSHHGTELGLNVILDPVPEENFFFRSDQLAFIQQGIPAVFFTTHEHEDYHQPSDESENVDADKAARVAKLGFLLSYHIAQDPEAPEWTEEGRAQIEEMLQQSPF